MDRKGRAKDNIAIENLLAQLKVQRIYINEYSNPREPGGE